MTCQTPEDDFVRWDAESVTCIGQNHEGACAPKASLATPMEENSRKRDKSNGVQNVDRGSENSYRQKEMERHSKKPYTPSGVRN